MSAPGDPRTVAVLGSTGALGRAVVAELLVHPKLVRITSLAAGRRMGALAAQAEQVWRASGALPTLAVETQEAAQELRKHLGPLGDPQILTGPEGLVHLATHPGTEIVLCAVPGLAAFPAAEAAAGAGRRLLLASKEVLALAGAALQDLATRRGGGLEPLDSELWAAASLLRRHGPLVRAAGDHRGHRLLLPASGGPLWRWPASRLASVTSEEVLEHPVWPLGPKIAVDSATQLNKAHEVVAAAQLFGFSPKDVHVAIHPEARIHAVLGLPDGVEVALAAPADMRGPARALLGLPQASLHEAWSLAGRCSFLPPDLVRFPGIMLGHRALALGAGGRAALVAADEAAVGAFLARRLPFPAIAATVAQALDEAPTCAGTLADLLATARALLADWSRRLSLPR